MNYISKSKISQNSMWSHERISSKLWNSYFKFFKNYIYIYKVLNKDGKIALRVRTSFHKKNFKSQKTE